MRHLTKPMTTFGRSLAVSWKEQRSKKIPSFNWNQRLCRWRKNPTNITPCAQHQSPERRAFTAGVLLKELVVKKLDFISIIMYVSTCAERSGVRNEPHPLNAVCLYWTCFYLQPLGLKGKINADAILARLACSLGKHTVEVSNHNNLIGKRTKMLRKKISPVSCTALFHWGIMMLIWIVLAAGGHPHWLLTLLLHAVLPQL